VGKPDGKRPLGRHGLDGSMGSVRIIGRLARECKLESTGSGLGLVQSCCKRGDKPSGSCPTELLSIKLLLKLGCCSLFYYY
jgi:hypothetical protein